jgi:caffeoyl-CoA O-methyltransferase
MADFKHLLPPELHDYLIAHGSPLDQHQRDLIDATLALGPIAGMQIAPEQGTFMTWLARLMAATNVVEVGTFTGYSTLCLARGLAPGGRVLACDVSDEWTSIGRAAWERAGVADRIELVLGPALATLQTLPADPVIDLAFIDADKTNYLPYYEALLPRLRPNGVILVDNVLWNGRVVDATATDADTRAIVAFNDRVVADERVDVAMLPVSDGLSLLRKH